MITCELMGGLGNQLFQIFATISYALKCNKEFYFSDKKILYAGENTTTRYTYWEDFLKELKPYLKNENELQIYKKYNIDESILNCDNIPLIINIPDNIILNLFGYFQSYKYFENNYNYIYNILKIDQQKKDTLSKLDKDSNYFKNTISLHFRRGDYKNYLDFHPIMNDDYYINSINYILTNNSYGNKNQFKIIYFCEDEDIDTVNETISKLSSIYTNCNFERIGNMLSDWEQMLLMSNCEHHIIANSSYSWWGAYFSKNFDNNVYKKIVCYPSIWFTDKMNKDVSNMFPKCWIKI